MNLRKKICLALVLSIPMLAAAANHDPVRHAAGDIPGAIPGKTRVIAGHVTASGKNISEKAFLWKLLTRIQQKIDTEYRVSSQWQQVNRLLTRACTSINPEMYKARSLKATAEQERKKLGLALRGAYTTSEINDDEGSERSYLELSWDVWKGGYQENRKRADSLLNKARATQIRAQLSQQEQTLNCRRYQFASAFSGIKSGLLMLKTGLMEPVYRIERRAYFKGWSHLDDYLVAEADLRLARRELRYLHSSPYYDRDIDRLVNPPVIDIDMQALSEAIRKDPRYRKITQLEKQSLKFSETNSYRSSLRFFVRKAFQQDNTTGNSTDLSAGVRFSIPLESRKSKDNIFKIRELEEKNKLESWQRMVRARAAYTEVREQLERVLKQQYRVMRAHERVRRSMVQQDIFNDEHLPVAIVRMRSLLDAKIEMAQAKEELYRRVNEVFLAAKLDYHGKFIRILDQEQKNRARIGARSVYLWSKGFNRVSNRNILNFLEAKGVRTVLLSAGKKTETAKMKQFIREARKRGLVVETITGSNRWIFPKHHMQAATRSAITAELTGKIHLDIEPHTLPVYKKQRDKTLNHYITMLEKIRQAIPQQKISVAVPMHWPDRYYRLVNKLADEIIIMAYETNDVNKLTRRLKRSLENLNKEKVSIAVRTKDFRDEWEMEKMISALHRQTGIKQFAIHQFREYLLQAGKQE
jgi:hypothetical protein